MGTYAQGAQQSGSTPVASRDAGFATFVKVIPVQAAGAATLDITTHLPDGAQVVDVLFDTVTAHTSASATIAIGFTAGGTDLTAATDVKTTPRTRPTFTSAQLTACAALARDTGQTDKAINLRLALGTATSAGLTNVSILYTLKTN
ncbi:MAG TPA: hypothetical protein PKV77_09560 [Bacteroidales bacterium]|nr:hypothetical protein [Bacteroidales bacterium]